MDNKNINELPKKPITVYTVTKQCGCNTRYVYPHCTKQDLIHGGCVESCACQKYKVIVEDCNKHNK